MGLKRSQPAAPFKIVETAREWEIPLPTPLDEKESSPLLVLMGNLLGNSKLTR